MAQAPPLTSAEGSGGARFRTLLLLSLVGFIEGADMQLLPATFKALETDMGLSPKTLGLQGARIKLSLIATLSNCNGHALVRVTR